ncbi:tetratricopeptide repeat protein [Streptomyces zhihengii]
MKQHPSIQDQEAELLTGTTSDRSWERGEAWHGLIGLLWSQERLAEGEEMLREAAGGDEVAAEQLERLLRMTGRDAESRKWHRRGHERHRLDRLVEEQDLGEAMRLVALDERLRSDLVELCAQHGLAEHAMTLADRWAREGDPAPALELYRRAGDWEKVLGVLPFNAPPELRAQALSDMDYGIEALVQLERVEEAQHEAQRLFESGHGSYAFVMADLMAAGARQTRRKCCSPECGEKSATRLRVRAIGSACCCTAWAVTGKPSTYCGTCRVDMLRRRCRQLIPSTASVWPGHWPRPELSTRRSKSSART